MSNWNYIKGYCRDQTHRDDISDEAMLNFQRVALSRINRDGGLRGQALRSVETVSFTPFFLPDECQEVLEISVQHYPQIPQLYFDLGEAYTLSRNYEKAFNAFQKVLKLVPNTPLARKAKIESQKIKNFQ